MRLPEPGTRFDRLTVVGPSPRRPNDCLVTVCQCGRTRNLAVWTLTKSKRLLECLDCSIARAAAAKQTENTSAKNADAA
jgi:hypothetical protein